MSTKIYNGLKIKNMNMLELNEYFKNIRKELIPIANEEYLKVLARIVECFIVYSKTNIKLDSAISDYSILKDNSLEEILYKSEKVALEIMKKNKAAETIYNYDSDFDFDAKICIIPIERKILAIPYIQNEKLLEKLLSKPEIEEYGYWNNTDRPNNISKDSWKRRAKNWNKALPGIGIPNENGFIIEILDSRMHAYKFVKNLKELEPYFSSNEKLKKQMAYTILMEKKYEEFKKLSTEEEQNSMSIYFKTRDYIKGHPEEIEKIIETIDFDIKEFLN